MPRKVNNKSKWVRDWSTQYLKEQYKSYYKVIFEVDCYGVSDILILELVKRELEKRGWEVVVGSIFTFIRR